MSRDEYDHLRESAGVIVEDPPAPTDDEPSTANGRDLLAHAVQYTPADADRKITAAKIIAVEDEARRGLRYDGRIDAFDAIIDYLRRINGNGRDEPSEPVLDAVYDKVADLRSRAVAARTVDRATSR